MKFDTTKSGLRVVYNALNSRLSHSPVFNIAPIAPDISLSGFVCPLRACAALGFPFIVIT